MVHLIFPFCTKFVSNEDQFYPLIRVYLIEKKKTNQYQKGESSMISHPDVYEKLIATRHAQIQHDMQQIRTLAHVRQRQTLVRSMVGSLGRLLIVLGSYLQQTGQRKEISFPSS
jgi:hypothetical protein